MSMTPDEAIAYMREHHMDAIRAVVAAAPPPPPAAIEMLRALGCPAVRKSDTTVSRRPVNDSAA